MTHLSDVRTWLWAKSAGCHAIQALAEKSGLGSAAALGASIGIDTDDRLPYSEHLRRAGDTVGVRVETLVGSRSELVLLLPRSAPCIAEVSGLGDEPLLIAVLSAARGKVVLLTPQGTARSIGADELGTLLGPSPNDLMQLEAVLTKVGLGAAAQSQIVRVLGREQCAPNPIHVWSLRSAFDSTVVSHIKNARVFRSAGAFLLSYLLYYAMWIAAWCIIGRTVLVGRLDDGWMAAWLLCLLTLVPLHMLVVWLQGSVAIVVGAMLRAKLLHSALKVEIDTMRTRGVGELLGRVLDIQTFESLVLGGGLGVTLGALELCVTATLLTATPHGALPATLLCTWVAVTCGLGVGYYRARAAWAHARARLTYGLVENMVGHRTRITQQRESERFRADDIALTQYERPSRIVDRWQCLLTTLPTRGWMLVGILGLGPRFLSESATPAELAISLGLILLAYRAFARLSFGLGDLAGAWVAADALRELLADRSVVKHGVTLPTLPDDHEEGTPLVEARELRFAYPGAPQDTLSRCTLSVGARDHIVLSGDSGGGKSTLLSLVAGLRDPTSGTLLVHGLDRTTLGDSEWRRRIALAPQFHENHVLAGTLAYNLLLGRDWPPRERDLEDAEAICRALGLGDLLDRMPSGLFQVVGETGWQLSHGERSRLFLARTLLQQPELVLLDESFAALDPETFEQCVHATHARARALIVAVHA